MVQPNQTFTTDHPVRNKTKKDIEQLKSHHENDQPSENKARYHTKSKAKKKGYVKARAVEKALQQFTNQIITC